MISGQPGALTIVLALAMTVLSGGAYALAASGRKHLLGLANRAYFLQIILALAASVYLYILIFQHDYSIEYIYNYSSSDLPWYYLLSSFWGGQDGTYLLWFLLSSLFGLLILNKGGKYTAPAMAFYSLINLFLTVMLVIVSPFGQMAFTPPDGAGLNPLLQDFWMVIHPPVMFCAFAMAGIPFALVMGAMAKKDYDGWIKIAFPYIALAGLLFFAANVMGGYWAYKTLGWGGYWAWDPVENTSFVPWLITLALIHGIIIEKRTGAMRRTNILLAIMTFLLVVYGTFLTRSGVLADFSVHSFVDLGSNNVLIGFMLSMVIISLGLFIARQKSGIVGKPLKYNLYSVDFILFSGLCLLFILGALVLFWSSLPLITSGLGMTPTAADIPTYNSFAIPMAIAIALFLTIAPLVIRNHDPETVVNKRSVYLAVIPLLISAGLLAMGTLTPAMAAIMFIYFGVIIVYSGQKAIGRGILISLIYGLVGILVAMLLGVRELGNLLFILAALTAAGAHVTILIKLIPNNLRAAGGHIAHFGLGLMLVGILVSSAYSSEKRLILPREQVGSAFGFEVSYIGTSGSIASKENEILLTIRDGETVMHTRPRFFYSQRLDGMMKRPDIINKFTRDIYLAPLDIQELPGGLGMHLAKGESAEIGDFNIKFIDFDMMSHGEDGSVSVGALLEVNVGNAVDTIKPIMTSRGRGLEGTPIPLTEGSEYNLKLEKIDASSGAITFSVPGLVGGTAPDQLILEVSQKPAINLVWAGSIIICFGMVLSFIRRREALVRS